MTVNELKIEIVGYRDDKAKEMASKMKPDEISAVQYLVSTLDLEPDWKGEQGMYLEKYGRNPRPKQK